VNQLGVCPENEWAYDDTPAPYEGGPFPVGSKPATHPPQSAYNDAVNYCVTSYQSLAQDASQLRGCLAAGFPFVYGFTVYDSFFSAPGVQKTVIPMPANSDASVGGHAVLCVGYDDASSQFICRNSWGPQQGDKGYFYMPYSYLLSSNLAADFWVINATAH
jgi:C1A family cysteine protease